MNRHRRSRRLRVFLLGLMGAFLLSGTAWAADQSVLTPGGKGLLKVTESRSKKKAILQWTLHRGGQKTGGLIPETAGRSAPDLYPWLFQDETGTPALVWSRHNGVDYDIAYARFDGASWSEPILLISTLADELQPRAYAAPGEGFHLTWDWPQDGQAFSYALIRSDTGLSVAGPERIRLDTTPDDPAFNPEGGTDDPGTGLGTGGGNSGYSGNGCNPMFEICFCDRFNCESDTPAFEGATATCESFSVVVQQANNACLLSRGADGWSMGACTPFGAGGEGAASLGRALGKNKPASCP
jgi:hypothetical protein